MGRDFCPAFHIGSRSRGSGELHWIGAFDLQKLFSPGQSVRPLSTDWSSFAASRAEMGCESGMADVAFGAHPCSTNAIPACVSL